MSNVNAMNVIVGYQEALSEKERLSLQGNDFSDKKWETRSTVAKLHPKRLQLQVSRVMTETATTKTFRMVSKSPGVLLPPFQAGQYVNLFVTIDGVETARPYAISSSPADRGYYDLTVKRAVDGFVSHYLLDKVVEGQSYESTGPMGTFHHNPLYHGKDLVFLAGGSGIAPARSMLKSMLDKKLPYQFHFIYASSFSNDVIFVEELRTLAAAYDNFRLTEVISRPVAGYTGLTGHLSATLITSVLGDVASKMFYICGPTPFYEFCQSQLVSLGVKNKHIRIEANGAPKNPERNAGWPEAVSVADEVTVTVKGKGSFKAKVGEPLLNSLERNGYAVENACRSGECSLCRVKVVSGEVFNPPEAHLRSSDKQFGWIHSCVAFPTQDIEILL